MVHNGEVALETEIQNARKSYNDRYYDILKLDPIPENFTQREDMDLDPQQLEAMEMAQMNSISKSSSGFSQLGEEKGGIDMPPVSSYEMNKSNFSQVSTLNSTAAGSSGGGFQKVQEKAKKSIERHSMLIGGTEYNRTMGRTYMMLGKSYYYSGKYLEALEVFNYFDKKLKHTPQYPEAMVYLAKSQAALKNNFEAEEQFILNSKNKLPKRVRRFNAMEYAQFLINNKRYNEAIEVLKEYLALEKRRKYKSRIHFDLAQLKEKLSDPKAAKEHYKLAYKYNYSDVLRVKSLIARAYLVTDKKDTQELYDYLAKLARKGAYSKLMNEIYFAKAVISERNNEPDKMVEHLKSSLKEPMSDSHLRGLAHLKMADYYFEKSEYLKSSKYYDSAARFLKEPELKKRITTKNKHMKEIVELHYLVKKNDSILSLVNMSEDERKKFFSDFISKIKKQEEEQKKKEAKEAEAEFSFFSTGNNNNPFNSNRSGGKWYFYNDNLRTSGGADFRKIWGNRPLQDNWRWSSKASIGGDELTESKILDAPDTKNPRRFELDYYLEKIPTDKNKINDLKIKRDSAELKLGILYDEYLKDKRMASSTLEHLIASPPLKEEVKLSALYNLYLIHKSSPEKAEVFKQQILSQYPESKFAKIILRGDQPALQNTSIEAFEAYEKTLNEYQNNQYQKAIEYASQFIFQFPNEEITPKFLLLRSISYGKLQQKDMMLKDLEEVITKFPDSPEATKAEEWQKKLK